MNKFKEKLIKLNHIFCRGMLCRTNLKRDIIIVAVAGLLSVLILAGNYFFEIEVSVRKRERSDQFPAAPSEKQIYEEVKKIEESVDTSAWKDYQNSQYGFALKYPNLWSLPKIQNGSAGTSWEKQFQFRNNDDNENNPYAGFDIVIYNVVKTKELANTDEFPVIKSQELKTEQKCAALEGHLIETGDYPAEEIYIPPTDDCYKSSLFFSIIRDGYIYNIVPVLKKNAQIGEDPRTAIIDNFPEFFAEVSTLNLIEIIKPKPIVSPAPKITAPFPVSYIVENGRLVCAKKNDRPSKSTKNKSRHLDMECCLDPDEYPNPHCYYPPAKYGKFL
jgi:hypothetical protein